MASCAPTRSFTCGDGSTSTPPNRSAGFEQYPKGKMWRSMMFGWSEISSLWHLRRDVVRSPNVVEFRFNV
jgi:hypothetical protein